MGEIPWKSFVDIGVEAARDALDDSGVEWAEIQFYLAPIQSATDIPGGCQHLHLPMHWGFKDAK